MELLKQFERVVNQRPTTTVECAFLLQVLVGGLDRIRECSHNHVLVREVADALRLFPTYVTGSSKVPRSRILLDLARATGSSEVEWSPFVVQYAQITGINLANFPREQLLRAVAAPEQPEKSGHPA